MKRIVPLITCFCILIGISVAPISAAEARFVAPTCVNCGKGDLTTSETLEYIGKCYISCQHYSSGSDYCHCYEVVKVTTCTYCDYYEEFHTGEYQYTLITCYGHENN